jgi:hypothetical protein
VDFIWYRNVTRLDFILIIDNIRKYYEIVVEHVSRSKDKGNLSKLMEDNGVEFVNSNQDLLILPQSEKIVSMPLLQRSWHL